MVSGASSNAPQSGGPVIIELPLDKIRRPLMRTRANDPEKVKDLMESIQQIGLQVPVSNYSSIIFLKSFFLLSLSLGRVLGFDHYRLR